MILTPCKVVIIISYINVKTEKNMKEFKVKAYGKSELAIHGSVIGDKLPAVRRAKCSFWINKDEDSITISIPTGVKAR